jgi:8-oxo-dGTP diphosphatase
MPSTAADSDGAGPSPDAAPVHVAVAVLRDARGRVLITRRHADSHQGGLWEFPGGKVEPGEDLAAALRRELHEELGIAIGAHRPLLRVRHDYGDKRVLLDVHEVLGFEGEARSCEGQPLRWVEEQELEDFAFPAANEPILRAVRERP